MRNNSTIDSLKAMRFSAMAAELERGTHGRTISCFGVSGTPILQSLAPLWKILSTMKTVIWTRRKF